MPYLFLTSASALLCQTLGTVLLCLALLIPSAPAYAQWTVAVLPFEDRSQDAQWSWLSNGIPDLVTNQFYKVPRILVLGRARMQHVLGNDWHRLSVRPDLANQLKVEMVIQGSYRVSGKEIEIQADVLDIRKGKSLNKLRGKASIQDLFSAFDPILFSLSQTLAVDLLPAEKTGLQTHPTRTIEAFRASGEAVRILLNSFAQDPPDQGLLQQAESGFKRAITLDPHYADPQFQLGQVYELRGDFQQAERAYRVALKADMHHVDARFFLGRLLKSLNRTSEALDELEGALRQSPHDPEIQSFMASIWFSRYSQTFETISAQFQTAIEANPDDPTVYYELGEAYHELGRFDEAAEQYTLAIEYDPNYGDAHFKLGLVYREKGRFEDAVAEFQTAIQGRTRFSRVHFRLGEVLVVLNKDQEAIASFKQALKFEPNYVMSYYHIGLGHLALGDVQEALTSFQQYSAFSPTDERPYYQLGETYRQRGDKPQALNMYRKAVEISPMHLDTHFRLGYLYAEMDAYEKAVQALQTVLRLDPNHPDAARIDRDIRAWQNR